jgi:hypothetical protein
MPKVAQIYRYPVKGLSAEPLSRASLSAGEVVPFDRAYAIENGSSGFDPRSPRHIGKINFLMLMRNERLAELSTSFDDQTQTLVIHRSGAVVAEGRLDSEAGKRKIESFFDQFSAKDLRGPAKVLSAPGHFFQDTSTGKVVSLINLDSVRAISRLMGVEVHPLRFRGNLYIEGLAAWDEFSWVGSHVLAGGVTFEVTKRIDRCAAIDVDPLAGERNLNIPRTMMKAYGHIDCGVYLKVVRGGELSVNETIVPGRTLAPNID